MKDDIKRRLLEQTGKSVPKLKRYLQEKQQMRVELDDQNQTINNLQEQTKDLAEEIKLLKETSVIATNKKDLVLWPKFEKDILSADLRLPQKKLIKRHPPFTINWVLPAMEKASGGRADILRTIAYLENKGHVCRLYFYDPSNSQKLSKILGDIQDYYPKVRAQPYYNASIMLDSDIIFATNYYSAYPVYNHRGDAHKYYYVQDYEPYFELPGSYHVFAENTYSFGLRGITIGEWLSKKLSKEFGMKCDYFDFGVDPKQYYLSNDQNRKGVLFYARPSTPRRGFEMGILALKIFHEKYPEHPIHMAGAKVSNYKIPFPYINHGVLSLDKLSPLYNQCSGGLVLSFSNMSLLPLEMLAAGCRPVVNEAPNTTMVPYRNYIKYGKPSPNALAAALGDVVDQYSPVWARKAAKAAKAYTWESSNEQIEKILINDLR